MNLQQLVEELCVKHDLVASDFLTQKDVPSLTDEELSGQSEGTLKVGILSTRSI